MSMVSGIPRKHAYFSYQLASLQACQLVSIRTSLPSIKYLQLEHEIEKIIHSFHRLRSERRITRTMCRGRAQWPITFLNTNL